MIQKYSCPSCAAEILFRSAQSVYLTCASCRSLVVRHGTNLDLVGKVSDLMDDLSLIQPRTKGRFKGRAFDVLGRLRIGWAQGFWNEWCLASDSKTLWLSEAQGSLIFYDRFDSANTDLVLNAKVGHSVLAPNGEKYSVSDVKKAWVVGVEGEVPGKIKLNEEYLSIDLQKSDSEQGTLDLKNNVATFSYGYVLSFSDFNFEYLRQLDGW